MMTRGEVMQTIGVALVVMGVAVAVGQWSWALALALALALTGAALVVLAQGVD